MRIRAEAGTRLQPTGVWPPTPNPGRAVWPPSPQKLPSSARQRHSDSPPQVPPEDRHAPDGRPRISLPPGRCIRLADDHTIALQTSNDATRVNELFSAAAAE
jgi:hypothetical protein